MAAEIARLGITSVVVSGVFSPVNDQQEEAVGRALEEEFGRLAGGWVWGRVGKGMGFSFGGSLLRGFRCLEPTATKNGIGVVCIDMCDMYAKQLTPF